MAHILLKTVLNFKMSHFEEFIANLELRIFFVGNRFKNTTMWQKVAMSEISSELMETAFFSSST